nr:signal recognition particle protein [Geodermatophilaceae bacterium]
MMAIKKMGSLTSLLGMLPGGGAMKDQIAQVKDSDLDRTAAVIRSMTPGERRDPAIIKGSRRARIANGAGVTVTDVNQLVERFFEARKMMTQMAGGMGLPGMRRSATRKSAGKKGKGKKGNRRGGGPTPPRLPGGMPAGFPGGLAGGMPGGGLPPGTPMPDLSKLKFPKS